MGSVESEAWVGPSAGNLSYRLGAQDGGGVGWLDVVGVNNTQVVVEAGSPRSLGR